MLNDTDKNKNGANPIAAAVTGAVVGAGVAIATAQALKNDKTREKVKQIISDVKDQTVQYMESQKVDTKIKNEGNKIKKIAKKGIGNK